MLTLARGWFRRSVFKTIRFLKHPRKLRQSHSRRWFARHFLDKRVWKPTQHMLAGGMAVGMFITLQLLPIQMPTAVILAALFRVNIPIALALCWVSNPVTVPFMAVSYTHLDVYKRQLFTSCPTGSRLFALASLKVLLNSSPSPPPGIFSFRKICTGCRRKAICSMW